MRRLRVGTTAAALLMTLAFTASAPAVTTNFTSSNVTAPADGISEFQNLDTNPNQTITVSGTTNWTSADTSNLFDVGCYSGTTDYHDYQGPSGAGIALSPDGSFSVTIPQSFFKSGTCHLVAVPHGTSGSVLPAGDNGPRVGFSYYDTTQIGSGPNSGQTRDYTFDDVTPLATASIASIDDCGPWTGLIDGSSTMNLGGTLFYCAGSFYNSPSDFGVANDLTRAEIQVDGSNAYGAESAEYLFVGSDALSGFPALSASVNSFDGSTGNAETTEGEPIVKCSPSDVYAPTSTDCTTFASTGLRITRVTTYTNDARVATVTDTFSSTDQLAHSLDLEYETDLGTTSAGWEFPGQTSFTQQATGATGPASSSGATTVYAIDDTSAAPSLANPVGAMTFITPYSGVTFDNTLWSGQNSALFDYQELVPAGGSRSISFSVATGSSMAEVQGYAADAVTPAAITIDTPTTGATVESSPATVSGTAVAGSGVKSVTVNGVTASVAGTSWSAPVPLTIGPNTLDAEVTSNAGSTSTATATVTYTPQTASTTTTTPTTTTTTPTTTTPTPGPTIRLVGRKASGATAWIKLACAASGANCSGTVTLRAKETVTRRHKKHTVMVVVASKRYAIAKGVTSTLKLALNASGRRLLRAHHKLTVKGAVSLVGLNAKAASAAAFNLTLKQPAKKKHK